MLSSTLLIAGVLLLSFSLRSFDRLWSRRLGTLGILSASFLCGWRLTNSWPVGVFCVASWLFLPWIEILTRTRKLSLPIDQHLRRRAAPDEDSFPPLEELTAEIELASFEHVEDCGWEWGGTDQFFRLFHRPDERTHGAICLIEHSSTAFYYISLSSRAKDGRVWTTWNNPFSPHLRLAPHWQINQVQGHLGFETLHALHREFLQLHGVDHEALLDIDPDQLTDLIQGDCRSQIQHNLDGGLLSRTTEGEVRYSWRGMFYLWIQCLRDILRLS